MNRLLQGDVGAGKTFVAIYAMLRAVEAGEQAALMAPTQILAEQHALNLTRWLEPLGVRVDLFTGNTKGKKKEIGCEEGRSTCSTPPQGCLRGYQARRLRDHRHTRAAL